MDFFNVNNQKVDASECCDLISEFTISGVPVIKYSTTEYSVFTDYSSNLNLDNVTVELKMKKDSRVKDLSYRVFLDSTKNYEMSFNSLTYVYSCNVSCELFKGVKTLQVYCNNGHKKQLSITEKNIKDSIAGTVEDYFTENYFKDIYFLNVEPGKSENGDYLSLEFPLFNPSFKTFDCYLNLIFTDENDNVIVEDIRERMEIDFNYVSVTVNIPLADYFLYESLKDACLEIGIKTSNPELKLKDKNDYFVRSRSVYFYE